MYSLTLRLGWEEAHGGSNSEYGPARLYVYESSFDSNPWMYRIYAGDDVLTGSQESELRAKRAAEIRLKRWFKACRDRDS